MHDDDVDISGFQELIEDHSIRTGFELPLLLEAYLSQLLTDRLGATSLVEEPSLAVCYMDLHQGGRYYGLKAFADQCLFFSSMLPEWSDPAQLTTSYWAALGTQHYHAYALHTGDERFHQLAIWFEPLQRFLASMVKQDSGYDFSDIYACALVDAKYSKGLTIPHENPRII